MRLLEAGERFGADLPEIGLDELAGSNAIVALRAGGETEAAPILAARERIGRLVVAFSGFKDGRGFSLAAILREGGFQGELIATGDLIPDHAPMLARCGFDAAELPVGASVEDWRRALGSFSAAYQPAADHAATVWARRGAPLKAQVEALNAELRDAPASEIVQAALTRFPGRVAVLSSFGAEAAVGLHLVAEQDASVPVLFLDTDRHFIPTLDYRDQLTERLGLTDVRSLRPVEAETHDPKGDLWRSNPDACCDLRKVKPLASVRPDFDVLITGRKRIHGGTRLRLPPFELVEGQIRVNPLANWSTDEIEAYFDANTLPRHPLTQGGYRSIGCWPCTQPSSEDEDARAGRWKGLDKTECGIHMPSRWVAEEIARRAS
ncbi:MAG: phosphoadenylyl-sulfate reductase [Proteobacteria bacterium]|nr:phosphoadenylyl-sulfate reductase [Pseudomonadota bacterium]